MAAHPGSSVLGMCDNNLMGILQELYAAVFVVSRIRCTCFEVGGCIIFGPSDLLYETQYSQSCSGGTAYTCVGKVAS
jgi:hypothetical protein